MSVKNKFQSDILKKLYYDSIFSAEGCFKIIFIFKGKDKAFCANIYSGQVTREVYGILLIKIYCSCDFVMFALLAY